MYSTSLVFYAWRCPESTLACYLSESIEDMRGVYLRFIPSSQGQRKLIPKLEDHVRIITISTDKPSSHASFSIAGHSPGSHWLWCHDPDQGLCPEPNQHQGNWITNNPFYLCDPRGNFRLHVFHTNVSHDYNPFSHNIIPIRDTICFYAPSWNVTWLALPPSNLNVISCKSNLEIPTPSKTYWLWYTTFMCSFNLRICENNL